jgi:hypothetical protein
MPVKTTIMKKIMSTLFAVTLLYGAAVAQAKRAPEKELKAQTEHVKSSGNDLLHFRFKKAHEKHVAEARRRNQGIAKDLRGEGAPPPKPPAPKKIVIN